MAGVILRTYLTPDIVDYCIIPYLLPAEEDVKKNYLKVKYHFLLVQHHTFHRTTEFDQSLWIPIALKKKYYHYAKDLFKPPKPMTEWDKLIARLSGPLY